MAIKFSPCQPCCGTPGPFCSLCGSRVDGGFRQDNARTVLANFPGVPAAASVLPGGFSGLAAYLPYAVAESAVLAAPGLPPGFGFLSDASKATYGLRSGFTAPISGPGASLWDLVAGRGYASYGTPDSWVTDTLAVAPWDAAFLAAAEAAFDAGFAGAPTGCLPDPAGYGFTDPWAVLGGAAGPGRTELRAFVQDYIFVRLLCPVVVSGVQCLPAQVTRRTTAGVRIDQHTTPGYYADTTCTTYGWSVGLVPVSDIACSPLSFAAAGDTPENLGVLFPGSPYPQSGVVSTVRRYSPGTQTDTTCVDTTAGTVNPFGPSSTFSE
jgi:hypothetical protein